MSALALVATASPAQAAGLFHAEGNYLVGSPVAYLALDACGSGVEDVDSSCFSLPSEFSGMRYSVAVTDALGLAELAFTTCFYDADGSFLDCDTTTVPVGTARVSISSASGADVSWTFDI